MKSKYIIAAMVLLLSALFGSFMTYVAFGAEEEGWHAEVINASDETVTFFFYWMDHPYAHINPSPIISAAGELKAGTNWHSTYPKKGEDYFILFRSGGETIAGVRLAMDKKGSYCKVTVLWDGEEVNIHRTIMKELKGRMLNASEI